MHRIASALTCLSCAVHASKTQLTSKSLHAGSSYMVGSAAGIKLVHSSVRIKALKALTRLLLHPARPTAAFSATMAGTPRGLLTSVLSCKQKFTACTTALQGSMNPRWGLGAKAQMSGGPQDPVLHIETPLVYSEAMSKHLGAQVYLKMDCLQPPGSFKIRGIGETVRRAVDAGADRIVSSSGGNAGMAAAYAARALGVPCTVVLPTTTPESVHERLRAFGAEVIVYGFVWDEADKYARKIVKEQKGAYVHPFDQQSTWEGHATLVDELYRQLPQPPDAIVTCVGGGGLLMGILHGLERNGWSSTRVVACETEGAASMAGALQAGELVTINITSVAKSLGAQCVGKEIFEKCKELGPEKVRSFVMSDAAAVAACVRLCAEHRVLVEPACGAALSAVLEKSDALEGCKVVVVEVCGGAIIDLPTLSSLAEKLGVLQLE